MAMIICTPFLSLLLACSIISRVVWPSASGLDDAPPVIQGWVSTCAAV